MAAQTAGATYQADQIKRNNKNVDAISNFDAPGFNLRQVFAYDPEISSIITQIQDGIEESLKRGDKKYC